MKSYQKFLMLALAILGCAQSQIHAQGTAFSYQGRLNLEGKPANGVYNMTFAIFTTNVTGTALAGPTAVQTIVVSNGLFMANVDPGPGVFSGPDRWLEISVRTNSINPLDPFATLAPRQQITASPYAIFAGRAARADALNGLLPAAQLSGTIAPANIAPGTVTSGMLAPGAVSMLGAPNGSLTNAVQVDNNGLVGIGTSTPAAGLQITSGAPVTTLSVLYEVANGQQGWTNINYALSSAANGDLLAVGGNTGVTFASITNLELPALLSQISTNLPGYADLENIYGMAWAGSNLVAGIYGVGVKPGAVFIIGCTNPANPVKLAEVRNGVNGWNDLSEVHGIAVSGNVLAIYDGFSNAVTLADISNPSVPALRSVILNGVNGFTNLNNISSVALSGNLLAIGAYYGVTLVDVSNPGSPVKLAELVNGSGGYTNLNGVQSVAMSGKLLAISAIGAVSLVDVSNPASPVKLAELLDGVGGYSLQFAGEVTLAGNRLAIASNAGSKAVTLVDVSDPANPVLLATASQGLNGANYLAELFGISFAGTNLVTCGFGNSIVYPNTPEGGVTIFGIGTESAGLSCAGWVGIGTTQPAAPLDVIGNVQVENATLFDVNALQVSLGVGSDAVGYISTALGYYTTASGYASTAMGELTTASGTYSTAMGSQADAINDFTFVWSDGSVTPFSSTTNNEFSICAQNGVHIQADKGIHLNAANEPIIVRDWDVFARNAPSDKAGIGRWGMFMETNTLVVGIAGDDVPGRYFQVAKYSTNGTPAMLMQVDQAGNLAAGGSLTVNGDARVPGLFRSGSETTSEAPDPAGMVVRRVNSTSVGAGQIVARTDKFTLERDGSNGGFLLRYPASPGNVTIASMGINSAGANVNFFTALSNPASAGTVQIYANAQNVVHFECSFGVTYASGQHLTQVTLSRWGLDNYWSGTLMSTYNQ